MSSTAPVSQSPMDWLKAAAPWNISTMVVTALVFQ
jgi:hypothetical protein